MRKFAAILLAVFLSFGFAFAAQEDSKLKGLEVGLEYGAGQKNIENYTPIAFDVAGFSGAVTQKLSDVMVSEELMTIGYKLSDNLTPYAIIGRSQLKLNQELIGGITGLTAGDITLAENQFRGSGLALGLGAKGNLLTFDNGIKVGYDLRWHRFSANDKSDTSIAPSLISYSTEDRQKASYNEINMLTSVSKEFAIKNSDKWYIPKSITPLVGYQFSYVNLKKSDRVEDSGLGFPIGIDLESSTSGITNAAVVGATFKMTENLNVGFTTYINNHVGGGVRATYSF